MVINRKVTGTSKSMPVGLGTGLLISAVVTIIGAMIVAWLVSHETLRESSIGYGTIGILLLSSTLGAWVAVKRIKRQRMVVSLLAGLCYFLLLVAITALFFGGQYSGMGVTAIVITAGSAAVGLMGLKEEGRNKKRFKRGHSR